MDWQKLGGVAPANLIAAREQAHWAAQVLSAAGETFLAHEPDGHDLGAAPRGAGRPRDPRAGARADRPADRGPHVARAGSPQPERGGARAPRPKPRGGVPLDVRGREEPQPRSPRP